MREVLRGLQPLGCTFGSNQQTTTFADTGRVAENSPLRAAYAHIEPTIFGYLAASFRLLRMPQVVFGLSQALGERSLVEHLLSVYGLNLAAIYGDNNTANEARGFMQRTHLRRFPGSGQPDWLVEALGERKEFTAGDLRLRTATTAVLASGVARAHQEAGVLIDEHDATRYCKELDDTVGFATNVELGLTSPLELNLLADSCPYVPLMNHDLLVAAGVPRMLQAVLNTEIAPGVRISRFGPQIMGLMWQDDRRAFSLLPSAHDTATYRDWSDDYAERNVRHNARVPEQAPAESNGGTLTRLHFFNVASRLVS